MAVILVACVAKNGVIGNEGKIPWDLPTDMKRFKELTTYQAVVMGSKTFESIGKPLPDRMNIVLSKSKDLLHYDPNFTGEVVVVQRKEAALVLGRSRANTYIIGGEEIYNLFMEDADKIYLSVLPIDYEGDAYFPDIDPTKWKVSNSELVKDGSTYYKYIQFERIRY